MAETPKPRKQLAKHGRRGQWVKVFLETGHELVRVQWKEQHTPGISGTESWTNTKENRAIALAYAEGKASTMLRGPIQKHVELTLRQVWEAYATANFPHLRSRSQQLYQQNFRRWALTWGWEFLADRTTLEMADEFRAASAKLGLATSTIRKTIYDVKMVFAWAEQRELLQRNRLRLYRFKIAKEDRPKPVDEYRAEEFALILSELNPRRRNNWRAYVALVLCGLQGARQHSVLHLKLDDIRLGYHATTPDGLVWIPGEITWQAEWDKTGVERKQPLRFQAQMLIELALEWHERDALNGPWLFPTASKKSKRATYSPQSLWAALVGAEARSGVPSIERRAAHGFRRMLAGDVHAETGDFMLALQAIGDTDPRMAVRYLRTRQDRVLDAFTRIDAGMGDLPASAKSGQEARLAQLAQVSNPQRTRNDGENETGSPMESPSQTTDLQGVTE
jgi:integrase